MLFDCAFVIPKTTPQTYLGGMAALNLPSASGSGDWHMQAVFFRNKKSHSRSFISGDGCLTNTNHILGERGIFDATDIVKRCGITFEGEQVFAATHARACVDLVLSSVIRGEDPDHVVLDDWMPGEADKRAVLELMETACLHVKNDALNRWMNDHLSGL